MLSLIEISPIIWSLSEHDGTTVTVFTYQQNSDLLMASCWLHPWAGLWHTAGWICPSTLLQRNQH